MSEQQGQKPTRPAKENRVEVRFDPELGERARQKAESRGWTLSAVIRALVNLWVDEDIVDPTDVGTAAKRASRSKQAKPRSSRKKPKE